MPVSTPPRTLEALAGTHGFRLPQSPRGWRFRPPCNGILPSKGIIEVFDFGAGTNGFVPAFRGLPKTGLPEFRYAHPPPRGAWGQAEGVFKQRHFIPI